MDLVGFNREGGGGGGGGFVLLALPPFLASVISSFFAQNKGEGDRLPGPSPRSDTGHIF